MKELERIVRRAGGILLRIGRHRYYELDGERITLHIGGRGNPREETAVKAQVRRILRRRSKGNP